MTLTLEHFEQLAAQSTEQVLLSGGDARLTLDPKTGVNKYGCGSRPDPGMIAFGSSTGSTISERGFAAASALHQRLLHEDNPLSESEMYHHELERIRLELNHLCGFEVHTEVATIFAASGTDLHLICAQLVADDPADHPGQRPLHIIMMEACETGSGVSPAVHCQHFSDNAALGGKVIAFDAMRGAYPAQVTSIALRCADGAKRPIADIDAEVDQLIQTSLASQQRVLLIMIDVSKTGLIAPSPGTVAALRARYPDQVDVLIDACQFRLASATLNAYLKHGCMVALTGSKFLTGPVFSGILHIPPNLIPRLSRQSLPLAMADYSTRAEWPSDWRATEHLTLSVNWGLLLRLEAALAELKAFRAIPEQQVSAFLKQFATAMQTALQNSPHFELMAETQYNRAPICAEAGWDSIPSIFPFLLLHRAGVPLSREHTLQIYRQLQFAADEPINPQIAALRCQLGQPVLCGHQYGMDVSALRMCASSRIVIEACASGSASAQMVINRALQALRKAELLIQKLS
ncbi:hypothetical protein AAKU67_000143 [Oxalobacteraceae bacterium GrIS 2.11]